MPNPTRISIRAALVAGAVAASLALPACGGDGDEAEEITITGSGKQGAAKKIDVESIGSGEAEITFDNQGKQPDEAQLVRVEGEHSAAEVASALGKVTSGKPFPDWFFAGGGVGATAPGKSLTVTQVLEPGTYWVEGTNNEVGSQGAPDPASLASFEVTGESSDAELPSEPAKVEAFEYSFKTEGLKKGKNTILFDNIGAQPHHLVIAPIKGGKDIADVEKAFTQEAGPPPIDEAALQSTAVLEGGTGQVVDLDLAKSGNYALFCAVTDRQGGPPHFAKGMITEVDVK
ncbi:MAG: hypothetical protein ACXWZM_09395 [Solirubrobacterales bacterium]